jgi:hypothetical protein
MRGRNHFKATDVRRAIRTVTKEGLAIDRVKIGPDGSIELVTKDGEAPAAAAGNEWDNVRGTDAA